MSITNFNQLIGVVYILKLWDHIVNKLFPIRCFRRMRDRGESADLPIAWFNTWYLDYQFVIFHKQAATKRLNATLLKNARHILNDF